MFVAVQMTKSDITGLQLQGSKKVPLSPNDWVNSYAFSVLTIINVTNRYKYTKLHQVAVAKVKTTLLVQMVHSVGG